MKVVRSGIRNALIIAVLLMNIGCDQISKNVARNNLDYGERISVFSDYFTLTKVENSGAFLSLGDNLPELLKFSLLMVLPALVLLGLLIFAFRKQRTNPNYALPIMFIVGGGIGNLYDRIRFGSVTDFMHMDFEIFQTGIFNMADVSIMIGVAWLLVIQFKPQKKAIEKT